MKNTLLITALLISAISIAQEEERVVPPPPPSAPTTQTGQDAIVDFPDVEARFPGGTEAMRKYIQDNVQYPEVSRQLGDQGRVYLTFIVELDGSISGVEVMRGGLTPELNAEAIRLVKEMPLWKPGEMKDKPVRVRCRLPITFILESPKKNKKKN